MLHYQRSLIFKKNNQKLNTCQVVAHILSPELMAQLCCIFLAPYLVTGADQRFIQSDTLTSFPITMQNTTIVDNEATTDSNVDISTVLKKHADERAALKKKHDKTRSSIPKKDRIGRQRFLEDALEEEKQLTKAHETELEELGFSGDDVARALTKLTISSAMSGSSIDTSNSTSSQSENQQNGGRSESKAARRRRKKAEQEAASQRRIDEEKAAMGPSAKAVELNAINSQLDPKQLRIHPIAADGHCLYSAIAHQMQQVNLSTPIESSVQSLRTATADFLKRHKQEYMPFIESVEGSDERFQKYCDDLRDTAVWGGHVELEVLAKVLSAVVEVYAADMPVVRVGADAASISTEVLRVSFHRQYLGLGEHYNSIVPKVSLGD